MGDSLSTVFATIVAAILMFLFPMIDTWERQDDLSYVVAYTAVVNTVDAVRNTGRYTEEMHNDLITKIDSTGNRFEVKIEHRESKVVSAGGGNISMVYINHYTNEILQKMKQDYDGDGEIDHEYKGMKKGDFFYITIKNTNKTQATVLKENIYGANLETFKIGVPYGGQIRNEFYDNSLAVDQSVQDNSASYDWDTSYFTDYGTYDNYYTGGNEGTGSSSSGGSSSGGAYSGGGSTSVYYGDDGTGSGTTGGMSLGDGTSSSTGDHGDVGIDYGTGDMGTGGYSTGGSYGDSVIDYGTGDMSIGDGTGGSVIDYGTGDMGSSGGYNDYRY